MDFATLVTQARSYRRFQENRPVDPALLVSLVDAVRLVPSTGNLQPLRYAVSTSPEVNARIFDTMRWAGLLKEWKGPAQGERPTGYIVICTEGEPSKNQHIDMGIAAQTLQLGLAASGVGCCMVANMNPKTVRSILELPETYTVLLVLGVGYPAETVVLETMEPGQSTAYWRDEADVHHVPKRQLDEVLVRRFPS